MPPTLLSLPNEVIRAICAELAAPPRQNKARAAWSEYKRTKAGLLGLVKTCKHLSEHSQPVFYARIGDRWSRNWRFQSEKVPASIPSMQQLVLRSFGRNRALGAHVRRLELTVLPCKPLISAVNWTQTTSRDRELFQSLIDEFGALELVQNMRDAGKGDTVPANDSVAFAVAPWLCPNVAELDLAVERLEPFHLQDRAQGAPVISLNNLTSLTVSLCMTNLEGLVASAPNLASLICIDCNAFAPYKLPRLTSLTLTDCEPPAQDLAQFLAGCPMLEHFEYSDVFGAGPDGTDPTATPIQLLAALEPCAPTIRTLNLLLRTWIYMLPHGSRVPDYQVDSMAQVPSLEDLRINHECVQGSWTYLVQGCPQLRSLEMVQVEATQEDAETGQLTTGWHLLWADIHECVTRGKFGLFWFSSDRSQVYPFVPLLRIGSKVIPAETHTGPG